MKSSGIQKVETQGERFMGDQEKLPGIDGHLAPESICF